MTGKNRTPYLRLTFSDVQYLVELLDEADHCSGDHTCANRREFSTLMVRLDDFLIKTARQIKEFSE